MSNYFRASVLNASTTTISVRIPAIAVAAVRRSLFTEDMNWRPESTSIVAISKMV